MQIKQQQPIVLEAETAKFVKSLDKPDAKPIYKLPIEEARKVLLDAQSQPKEMPDADIEERHIFTGPNGTVSVHVVSPKNSKEALPAVMFFHGGGWILGNFKTHERLVRELAVGSNSIVIFVNFSPAPEARFPVAIEEAYAATKYVAEHASEFNVQADNLIVCGDSVGGNMAIAVTLMAKERGGPKIVKQILFYPVTDANFETPSYEQFAEGPWLTKAAMQWFWDAYTTNMNERNLLFVSPLRMTPDKLVGLPKAWIITAENDVLRDEGEGYAHKLMQAGVEVEAMRFLGTIHDFVMLDALAKTPAAKAAVKKAVEAIKCC